MIARMELVVNPSESGNAPGVGVEVFGSGNEAEQRCILIAPCGSPEELAREAARVKEVLDQMVSEAESVFARQTAEETDDPEEIWKALEKSEDEEAFVSRFNALEEEKRIEVANYVLATQNVFKGWASVFSMRYQEDTHSLV